MIFTLAQPARHSWLIDGSMRSKAAECSLRTRRRASMLVRIRRRTFVTVAVSGTATDEGLPVTPGVLTTTWSATGGGAIGDASALSTTVTFAGRGIYTVTLTADDGELTAADSLTVHIDEAEVPSVDGYWMLEADGIVYPFGDATPLGDAAAEIGATIAVAMTSTATSGRVLDPLVGWSCRRERRCSRPWFCFDAQSWRAADEPLVDADEPGLLDLHRSGQGSVPFGGASVFGDVSDLTLDGPIVASVAMPDGLGYYLLGSDGGVFSFGTAVFFGSVPQVLPGVTLDGPIVGIVPTLTGGGYWLVRVRRRGVRVRSCWVRRLGPRGASRRAAQCADQRHGRLRRRLPDGRRRRRDLQLLVVTVLRQPR